MEPPQALYRRCRPETFAEVIGQDHVTEPLRAALANNRVHHAYLFSGPRGCGKTTSARILARALNCEQAPVAEPCGECRSCEDLARGGPGSLDVIEIDAASHGGVDDARDLREKAFFAPVQSAYKVYIIDEAHMVSREGFNALLKLVEEPPPHLRFIFATTMPDKVLPTIRSRTHHYPFRLIPPRQLTAYLTDLCAKEAISIEPAALSLVVRAGAGSARDTLSVLDQLVGGAGPEGVTHDLAAGLLGFTADTMLDDLVDAFAAGDGGAVFGAVDRVIESGQDPRRFTEDLLHRLRDLVVVSAVPDAATTGLIDVAEDQGQRLAAQAARIGPADLSRAAALVATGLTEMRGATAPRLLLELICARLLLPGADHTEQGILARLDRLERRLAVAGEPSAAPRTTPPTAAAPPASTAGSPAGPSGSSARAAGPPSAPEAVDRARTRSAGPAGTAGRPAPGQASPGQATPGQATLGQATPAQPGPAQPGPDATAHVQPGPGATAAEAPAARAAAEAPAARAAAEAPGSGPAPTPPGGLGLVEARRLWPDIVEAIKLRRRVTWIQLTQYASVVAVDRGVLTLGFTNAGARESFVSGGGPEIVRQAAIDVVGADWKVEAIIDLGARPEAARPEATRPEATRPEASRPEATRPEASRPEAIRPARQDPARQDPARQDPARQDPGGSDPDATASRRPATTEPAPGSPPEPPACPAAKASPDAAAAAKDALRATRAAEDPRGAPSAERLADEAASPHDPDAEGAGLAGAELLRRELGAEVIEEIPHA